jgi:protein-S-isoprenylcysteine O-methyltransferase Ste14
MPDPANDDVDLRRPGHTPTGGEHRTKRRLPGMAGCRLLFGPASLQFASGWGMLIVGGARARPEGMVMKVLDLKIPPVAVLILFALAVIAMARWLPSGNLPFVGSGALALVALMAGIAVALAGVVAFARRGTTVNPLTPERATALVDVGVYRWTRNPMYLGMALALLGLALWCTSLPGVALVSGFCAYITRFQIMPEERALHGIFGEPYAAYRRRVRRWI